MNTQNFKNMRILVYLTTVLFWALGAKAAELSMPKNQNGIKIESEGYTLFGTLQLPENKENLALVLLISGSGPSDRDGNQPNMMNNSLKYLAEELAANGIASVRYDKRGVAASTVPGLTNSSLIFEDYVTDASNWVKYFKAQKKYKKIVVAGLSEGSLIGMLATHRAGADGFISLNGPGRSADEVILNQISKQGSPQAVIDQVKGIIAKIKKGDKADNVPPYLMSLFSPELQPYMKSWFSYNPKVEIGKLEVPVLIIQGENDLQVEIDDAKMLNEASPNATYVSVSGMNHILKYSSENPQMNIASYNNPDLPVHETVVDEVVKFIKE